MTTATITLTEFLLARIAEDEDLAVRDLKHRSVWRDWVLAECEAKRRIMGERLFRDRDPDYELTIVGARILGALALPYADHPDYREEWKP